FLGIDLHFDVFDFGQHGHPRHARMDAPLRLGLWHALDTVPAALEAEIAERTLAFDAERYFAHAARVAFGHVLHDHLPAFAVAVALVEFEEVADPEGGFVAADARVDFNDHV